jgi:5-methylcytosine-specific restriction endonuclease McrA
MPKRDSTNYENKTFGSLTVISQYWGFRNPLKNNSKNTLRAKCVCCCGKEIDICIERLKSGNTKSCGCLKRENLERIINNRITKGSERRVNYIGNRYFRLLVIDQYYENKRAICICKCDCGIICNKKSNDLISQRVRSCGCYRKIVHRMIALKNLNKRLKESPRKNRKKIMSSFEYEDWRNSVFTRDDYTCQNCKQRGGKICAHHIKEWCNYPESRYELSNGQTLCCDCHKKTNNYGYKAVKNGKV